MAKKKIKKTQPCSECGGRMAFKTKADRLEYKGHTKMVRTKGWWCDSCDEGILDGEALKASEMAFMELKAEVDGILSPEEVARAFDERDVQEPEVVSRCVVKVRGRARVAVYSYPDHDPQRLPNGYWLLTMTMAFPESPESLRSAHYGECSRCGALVRVKETP
jgi:YgiT-type zinc finger domain-containing protein